MPLPASLSSALTGLATLSYLQVTLSVTGSPSKGAYIQLLGKYAPKYHTIVGSIGPNSRMVVYEEPLGK